MRNSVTGSSVLSILLPLAAVGTLAAGAAAYDLGMVSVSVRENGTDGHSFRLMVPGVVVPVAMRFIPDRPLHQVPVEISRWLPAIKAAAEELGKSPGGPLVEVESHDERVTLALENGSLDIQVDSESESVHVEVPLTLVRSMVSVLEERLPPPQEESL